MLYFSSGPRLCFKLLVMNHKLHSLCPYFAMFPPAFARDHISTYTFPREVVLDPFSGRGTTVLEALLNERQGIASDINPVAYCISAAKAQVPALSELFWEIDEFERKYSHCSRRKIETTRNRLPHFFRRAFQTDTLSQLLFLKERLNWRHKPTHRFLAAIVLGHLHGESNKSPNYLSNQMPHSISTKPAYSLAYWREGNLWAPRQDVFELLRERAEYRLQDDPPPRRGRVALCDVRKASSVFRDYCRRVAVVVTSPPYLDTTNFEEDQWLRLWFLGGPPWPTYGRVSRDDRYSGLAAYASFLQQAWRGIKSLLKRDAKIILRIGGKGLDKGTICEVVETSLVSVWPRISRVAEPVCSVIPTSQAKTLSPSAVGCRFEMDFVYSLS